LKPRLPRFVTLVLAVIVVAGCSAEDRPVGRERVRTPPTGPDDRRIALYQENRFQVSQGARYFTWYGCVGCHGDARADTALNLADGRWRQGGRFDQVYAAIAEGPDAHRHAARMPVETLWQVTAYVRDLERNTAAMRRRQDLDLKREPGAGE
jgi:cytochrome c oxidase cbb3-type subunit 3